MTRDTSIADALARAIPKNGRLEGTDVSIPDSFFASWTVQVRRRFAREIEALRRDMEERAFLATNHGATYSGSPTDASKG